MLKILNYDGKRSYKLLDDFLNKRKLTQKSLTTVVNKIIKNVKKNGDKAVLNYEKKFSKVKTNSYKVLFYNE